MDSHDLVVEADGQDLAIEATIRSSRPDAVGRTILGLEFLPDQNLARAGLALALFRTTVVPGRIGVTAGPVAEGDGAVTALPTETAAA